MRGQATQYGLHRDWHTLQAHLHRVFFVGKHAHSRHVYDWYNWYTQQAHLLHCRQGTYLCRPIGIFKIDDFLDFRK